MNLAEAVLSTAFCRPLLLCVKNISRLNAERFGNYSPHQHNPAQTSPPLNYPGLFIRIRWLENLHHPARSGVIRPRKGGWRLCGATHRLWKVFWARSPTASRRAQSGFARFAGSNVGGNPALAKEARTGHPASYFLAIDDILEKFNSPGHIHAALEYTKLSSLDPNTLIPVLKSPGVSTAIHSATWSWMFSRNNPSQACEPSLRLP